MDDGIKKVFAGCQHHSCIALREHGRLANPSTRMLRRVWLAKKSSGIHTNASSTAAIVVFIHLLARRCVT